MYHTEKDGGERECWHVYGPATGAGTWVESQQGQSACRRPTEAVSTVGGKARLPTPLSRQS